MKQDKRQLWIINSNVYSAKEEGIAVGEKQGKIEGKIETQIETAKAMMKDGVTVQVISAKRRSQ
jgi:hypothetical protein